MLRVIESGSASTKSSWWPPNTFYGLEVYSTLLAVACLTINETFY